MRYLLILLASFVLFSIDVSAQSCRDLFLQSSQPALFPARGIVEPPKLKRGKTPESQEDFDRAVTRGFVPDLNVEKQRSGFKTYVKAHIGTKHSTEHLEDDYDEIAKAQKKYPELGKYPFAPVRVNYIHPRYRPIPELQPAIEAMMSLKQPLLERFYDGNETELDPYWRGAFGTAEEFRSFIKKHNGDDDEEGDAVKKPNASGWNNKIQAAQFRLELLYQGLKEVAEKEASAPKRAAVRKIIMDIAFLHSMIEHKESALRGLNSTDGRVQLIAFETILRKRGDFFEHTSRYFRDQTMAKTTNDYIAQDEFGGASHVGTEVGVRNLVAHSKFTLNQFRLPDGPVRSVLFRVLSFAEASLRGCLGVDCSTDSYQKKAFENRYQYFTITDEQGNSDGQLTIVTGSAADSVGKSHAVAYLDKIQHVRREDVAWVLEAARQTFANDGYTLVLPVNLGGRASHAITVFSSTHDQIEYHLDSYINQDVVLSSFEPDKAEITFDKNSNSRANHRHDVKPLLKWSSTDVSFEIQKKVSFWRSR